MEDKLREMLRELGRALSESSEASEALRRFQEEGYDLFLMLDRSGSVAVPAGHTLEGATAHGDPAAATPPALQPVFRIHGQDLRFLRSIGIDPTRRIRRRPRN